MYFKAMIRRAARKDPPQAAAEIQELPQQKTALQTERLQCGPGTMGLYWLFPYAGMTRIRFTGEGCSSPSLSQNASGPPKIICSAVI